MKISMLTSYLCTTKLNNKNSILYQQTLAPFSVTLHVGGFAFGVDNKKARILPRLRVDYASAKMYH